MLAQPKPNRNYRTNFASMFIKKVEQRTKFLLKNVQFQQNVMIKVVSTISALKV